MARLVLISVLFVIALGSACSGKTSSSGRDDAGAEDARPDGEGDASQSADATIELDAASGCKSSEFEYSASTKACESAADCTIVQHRCYCGYQPVVGIAKDYLYVATICESNAAKTCALGCPQAEGNVVEDGHVITASTGGTIAVRCDDKQCKTYAAP